MTELGVVGLTNQKAARPESRVDATASHPSSEPEVRSVAEAMLQKVIHERKNTTPRRLQPPGPNATQLDALLATAAAAPDHGRLKPWRFIIIPNAKRGELAQVFRLALEERCPDASIEQLDAAASKAARSPLLLIAVADLSQREPGIAVEEHLISLGSAIQNMLLLASAMGFGCGLSSGHALNSKVLRETFQIKAEEKAICFLSFGSVEFDKLVGPRSAPAAFCSVFGAQHCGLSGCSD